MSQEGTAGSPIRTPDQRLRVFVSSTLGELAGERAAVARAISTMGLTPVMFELGARPHPPQELYRAYLAQSDIFVGLYWQSYGWVGPGMDISGLEDEFRLSGPRPRLLYLKSPAPDREPRLSGMIEGLRTEGRDAYRSFRSTRELGRLVRDDLAVLLSERFAGIAPIASPGGHDANPPAHGARSLPATTTTLIGREDDIRAVVGMLEQGDTRLVTLTGPGGMGKTRLAIAIGTALEERRFAHVVFVPLANVSDSASVVPRMASAVGASVEGTGSALDALVEHLADADTLLVLDNLEQVIDVAGQLDELLARSAGLKILATSRTALRLRAEREYAVPALTAAAGGSSASIERIAALPAVRLFMDRAGAVRRDFALTSDNAPVIAEICRRLDGLPLAIELAAARIRLLEPAALLARLETVLDALGTGPVDLPERQRTLRATAEWSVGLLGDAEECLLATLSAFADGWTIGAAAAVAAADEFDTLDLLDALARHSLVSVDASGAEPRFRMLTTVRELAAERLRARVDHDDVARRHAGYFASFIDTDTVPADLRTPWADRLRAEEENVRVAISWFFAHDVARLPHLLRSLWLYWQTNDRLVEGRGWVTELQSIVALPAWDDRSRAEVLFTQAVTAVAVGDDATAVAAARDIPALLPLVDEPALRNALHLAVSWSLPIIDDFDGALLAATHAYEGFRAHDDAFVAFAALTVGMLQSALDRDEPARGFLREADDLGTRFGNRWLTSSARTQLAVLDTRAGAHEAAGARLQGCLDDIDDDQVGTITACFLLTAFAELAVARSLPRDAGVALGAVHGLRDRAGLLAWPIARRGEAALQARVAGLLDVDGLRDAYAAGSVLRAPDALLIVRRGIA